MTQVLARNRPHQSLFCLSRRVAEGAVDCLYHAGSNHGAALDVHRPFTATRPLADLRNFPASTTLFPMCSAPGQQLPHQRKRIMRPVFALLILCAIARGAYAQQSCEPDPAPSFEGVIGRTAQDSTPSLLQPARPSAGSPNVVYIVLDDTGFADLGCYGSAVSTPSIDSSPKAACYSTTFSRRRSALRPGLRC